jgi:hypothetical protein
MKNFTKLFLLCITALLLYFSNIAAQIPKKGVRGVQRSISGTPSSTKLNINNISTYVYNNGLMDVSPAEDVGFIYPKGSGKGAFYASGFLMGGTIDDYWSVSGSTYRSGLQPGRILGDGTAENPNLASVRIYRVRSDYKNFTDAAAMALLYADEIADEGKTAEEIYSQYDLNWKEWPAQYGAPYIDKDGNGVYNPAIDIPGVSEESCQTVWYAANDLDAAATVNLYGSLPMKIEIQATFFAFKTSGALGNTLFKKYKVINKNSKKIENMYFSMWSDPELGGAFDDCVGCDTTLNLSFVYNNTNSDEIYGATPPSSGFVIVQGPVVASSSDSARVGGRLKRGYKNLGMSTFYNFNGGTTADYGDPSPASYTGGALSWKNIFEGKLSRSGNPVINPATNRATMFHFSGDPVAGTGWLDPRAGDSRMATVSGAFTMNPGDTQEVVFAQIASGGTSGMDRLASLNALKYYAYSVQMAYEGSCWPTPPPAPSVEVSEMDNSLILSWSKQSSYSPIEAFNKFGYKFEGYNVYQLPSAKASLSEGIRIATYDIINGITTIVSPVINAPLYIKEEKITAYGTDSGISRSIKITDDKITGASTLINGSKYYFTVTAYAYSPNQNILPRVMESSFKVVTGTPQSTLPGVRYNSTIGDQITAIHSAGEGLGSVALKVFDPTKVTGHNYQIRFENTASENQAPAIKWFVKDITTDKDVLTNQTVYSGVDLITGEAAGANVSSADGLNINVAGSATVPEWIESVTLNGTPLAKDDLASYKEYSNSNYDLVSAYWADATGGTSNGFINFKGKGSTDPVLLQNDIELRFTGVREVKNVNGINVDVVTSGGSLATLWSASLYELINHPLNPDFGVSGAPFLVRIPFEVWDVENNVQITCLIKDREGKLTDGVFQPFNLLGRMYVDFLNLPYNQITVYNPAASVLTWMKNLSWALTFWRTKYTRGDVIRLNIDNPLTIDDKFTFTGPTITNSIELAKEDADKINVFPNPYYGLSPEDVSTSEERVTFTHLPQRANIKIFSIAGQLVRIINKEETGQYMNWDLRNSSGERVSSGIYVAHIELPDLGKVKTLKFAVIQGQRYKAGL